MSTFPSILSTYTNPNPTDRLNSPSHSGIETNQNGGLTQVEAVIGVEGAASLVGTLQYLIKSPASDGGGHVQTANRGGTGQTNYNKGDLLVGQSTSMISKLAITVTDGLSVVSDSTQATGIRWGTPSTSRVAISSSTIATTTSSVTSETSMLSVIIPASTLGTGNALRANVFISNLTVGGGSPSSVLVKANYGNTAIASVLFVGSGNFTNMKGKMECNLIANGSSAQVADTIFNIAQDKLDSTSATASAFGVYSFMPGSASVDSGANQTFGVTVRFSTNDVSNLMQIRGYVIEKIV